MIILFAITLFDWLALFLLASLCAAAGASRYEQTLRPDEPQPTTDQEADRQWNQMRRQRWLHSLFTAWVFVFACRAGIFLAILSGSPFTFFIGGLLQPESGILHAIRSFFSFNPSAITVVPAWEQFLMLPLLAVGSLVLAVFAAMTAAFFRRSREF